MTDKILCPWCGAEMRASVAMLDVYGAIARYECSFCHACGPQRRGLQKEETSAAARAAALRRYTPPIKPMTFEEVERVVFSNDLNDEMPMYLEDADGDTGWEISCQMTYLCRALKDDYGKSWRCWERKPTDEERSAAGWETSK